MASKAVSFYNRYIASYAKFNEKSPLNFGGGFSDDKAEKLVEAVENKDSTDSAFKAHGIPARYGSDSALLVARFAEGVITFKSQGSENDPNYWITEIEFWLESATRYDRLEKLGKGARLQLGANKYTRSNGNLKSSILTSKGDSFDGGAFVDFNGFEAIVWEQLQSIKDKFEQVKTEQFKR